MISHHTLQKPLPAPTHPRDHVQVPPPVVVPSYFRTKMSLSRLLAALLIIPALPVILVAIIVIRLTSRGPGVYRQVRVGLHGKLYTMYKLRSMRIDAEAATGAKWSQVADPRVTRVGRVLRKLHIDEFPQLFNVLKGEMSLVGPRPERPEFVQRLARQIPGYLDRLAVRPGITGLAQLNLPPDTDLDDVRRKLILDLEYIQTANLWLDLRLVLCTGLRVFKLPIMKLFGLQRTAVLSPPPSRNGNGRSADHVATPTGHDAPSVKRAVAKPR